MLRAYTDRLSGIPHGTGHDPGRHGLAAIAIDQINHRAYVAHYYSGDVTVIDMETHATRSVPIGGELEDVAVEAKSNKVYVIAMAGVGPAPLASRLHATADKAQMFGWPAGLGRG